MAKTIEVFTGRCCGPSVLCRNALRKAPFEFSQFDIEQDANKAMQRGIRAVPTFLILEDGEIKKEVVGFDSQQTFKIIEKELN